MYRNEQLSQISLIVVLGVFILVTIGLFSTSGTGEKLGGQGGLGAQSCTMSATTSVMVGNQTALIAVPTSTRAAYVKIQQPMGATNTVAFGFGAAPVFASGYRLATSSASVIPDSFTYGLNTDFPYTGAVYALTSAGTSSLNVIICNY